MLKNRLWVALVGAIAVIPMAATKVNAMRSPVPPAGAMDLFITFEGVFAPYAETSSNSVHVLLASDNDGTVGTNLISAAGGYSPPAHIIAIEGLGKYFGLKTPFDEMPVQILLGFEELNVANAKKRATWIATFKYAGATPGAPATSYDAIPRLKAQGSPTSYATLDTKLLKAPGATLIPGLGARFVFSDNETMSASYATYNGGQQLATEHYFDGGKAKAVNASETPMPYATKMVVKQGGVTDATLVLTRYDANGAGQKKEVPITLSPDSSNQIVLTVKNVTSDELNGAHNHLSTAMAMSHSRLSYLLTDPSVSQYGGFLFFRSCKVNCPASDPFCNGPVRFQ